MRHAASYQEIMDFLHKGSDVPTCIGSAIQTEDDLLIEECVGQPSLSVHEESRAAVAGCTENCADSFIFNEEEPLVNPDRMWAPLSRKNREVLSQFSTRASSIWSASDLHSSTRPGIEHVVAKD